VVAVLAVAAIGYAADADDRIGIGLECGSLDFTHLIIRDVVLS
jgi:hypothetical protein